MAGIVKVYRDRVRDQYIMGLWGSLMWMDLGWYCLHSLDSRPGFDDPVLRKYDKISSSYKLLPIGILTTLHSIPSWSWLSMDCRYISSLWDLSRTNRYTNGAQLGSFHCLWEGPEYAPKLLF